MITNINRIMKYDENIYYFRTFDGSQLDRVQFPGENSDSH